jgi:acyl-CoA thioester hydrolase
MENFKYTYVQPVDWGDMDAFNHVNNVIYFRYLESARIGYMQNLGWWDKLIEKRIGIIVASLNCKYRRPVTFPDTLDIGVRVEQLRRERFTVIYHAYSRKEQKLMAEGESLMVSFDLDQQLKTPLPPVLFDTITRFENSGEIGG